MESNTTALKSFSWEDVNWDALRRLRKRFLQFTEQAAETDGNRAAAGAPDYWRSHSELESYDFTFAERIGWKWDTVLAELGERGWTPPDGPVLDYGCGTGVAGRRVTAWLTAQGHAPSQLLCRDRSQPAAHFAVRQAKEAFPEISVEIAQLEAAPALLVVSHLVNELNADGLEQLLAIASRAQAVLWVEPGTVAVSRALIAVRERLLEALQPVAPCCHSFRCGMLAPGNERHWCHHFARVPRHVFQDSGWGRFAKTLEIDLGSAPFSYLVLERRGREATESGCSRIIGEPRHYKGFSKILSCQEDGVRELLLQKRDDPVLLKQMKKDPGSLYRWERDADRIVGGTRLF